MTPVLNNARTEGQNYTTGSAEIDPIDTNAESNAESHNSEEEKFGENKLDDSVDKSLILYH